MSGAVPCDHQGGAAVPTRRVEVLCPECEAAGIPGRVVGRGWVCACGSRILETKVAEDHRSLSSHHEAIDALRRRAAFERELAGLRSQIAAAKGELAAQAAEAEAKLDAARDSVASALRAQKARVLEETRVERAELEKIREQLAAERAALRSVRAEARTGAEEIVQEARAEADQVRAEIAALEARRTEARMELETELEEIAFRRKDRLLWDAAPDEVVAFFQYLDDLEQRTDRAIAVLSTRGDGPKTVARVLHVGVARVETVLRGAGVAESVLESVRSQMGPRPDFWVPSAATEEEHGVSEGVSSRSQSPTPQPHGLAGKRPFTRPKARLNRQSRVRCDRCGGRVSRWHLARHRSSARCLAASGGKTE